MGALFFDTVVADSVHESVNMTVPRTAIPIAAGFTAVLADDPWLVSDDIDAGDSSPPAKTVAGDEMYTSMDDWYYRLHFVPYRIDLGNLAGDQQRDFTLWNSNFTSVELEDFDLIQGEGITAITTVVPPQTIPALQTVGYSFLISGDGPAEIDAIARFEIDGVSYDVPITGRRTTLFGFAPNWRTPVKETLEWKTSLATAYSGLEQRQRMRDIPRRIFEFQSRLHNDDMRLFDVITWGWVGRMYSLPLWHEKTYLTQVAPVGTSTLWIDTFATTFAVDGAGIVYDGPANSESIEVLEVYADRIVIKGVLARDWPVGTAVYPTLPSAPASSFATTRQSDTHVDVGSRFTASPTECIPRLPVVAPAAVYRGAEMYTVETNWATALNIQIEARRTEVDNTIGPMRIKPKADFPLIVRGFAWLCKSRAYAEDLRAFFVRRDGRRVPVWMPSGVSDFELPQPIPLTQASFFVRKSEYRSLIGMHEGRRDLVFIMRDGTRYPRRIINVVDSAGGTVMTLDSDFPVEIRPENVKRISYLGLYRLGSDSVTFNWHSDQVATVDVTFVLTIPREGT